MKKNTKAGQPLTSQKQTLQHLDANDPRLHHAAARRDHRHSRYEWMIYDRVLIDSIGTPPPPPSPPTCTTNTGADDTGY